MSVNLKNTVIILSLVLVTIPFILVTDLFPFLRFGMFAEPVKTVAQNEYFILTYLNKDGKEQEFNSKEIGLEPHQFYYLVRNYYYRGESDKLIDNIHQSKNIAPHKEWKIKKLVINNNSYDTSTIYKKTYEK